MRAVVTGGDGFAGRWLCRSLLDGGSAVVAWVHHPPTDPIPGVRYRTQDIRDADGCRSSMGEDQPSTVFHLAAMTRLSDCEDRPALAHAVNVQGTANVFEAMPPTARGLLASTCHVYGRPQVACIDEAHPTEPRGVYAQSKFSAEREALASGRDVVIARAFHHTGPGQAATFVLASWAAQMRSGLKEIAVGDLDIRRDFCDVRDIVDGYRLLLDRGEAGTIYNLASGQAIRLGTLFDWMRGDRPFTPMVQAERIRPDDIPVFCGNPRSAEAIGWRRQYAIKDTLAGMAH